MTWNLPTLPADAWVALIGVFGSLATIIIQNCFSYRRSGRIHTEVDAHNYRIRQLEKELQRERRLAGHGIDEDKEPLP